MICHAVKILGLVLLVSGCGGSSDSDDPVTPTTTTTVTFAEVDQVLTDHCGGTACHASGASNTNYVGNETNVVAKKAAIISRVVTNENMPPSSASTEQLAITAAERKLIQDFLSQN